MKLLLKNVRIAFCQNLFTAGSQIAGSEPKFGCTLLIEKDDAQVQAIKKTIQSVAAEKWTAKADKELKTLYAGDRVCLRDGDTKEEYDGFEGCYFINASSKSKPTIIDRDRSELIPANGKPYAGCFVNASIDVWAQDNQFGRRINASLRGVQFYADGDAFAGSAPASKDEFEDLGDTGDADDLI